MKILVLDDTKTQLDAAAEQLAGRGHELTLVSKFSEARALMAPHWDREKKETVPGTMYDVVLTDLFLPGEREGQGSEGYAFIGELLPTGLACALLALKTGTPKVAIVSDGNHHAHPLVWALDALQSREGNPPQSAAVNTVLPGRLWSFTGYECPVTKADVKDWAKVVDEITKA